MSELRRLRLKARLTVDALAEKADVSPRQIRNIEDGTTGNPRVETLGSLADALSEALTKDKHSPVVVELSDIDPYTPKAAA